MTVSPMVNPVPPHYGQSANNADYGAGWDVVSGYSSCTLLSDVGGPHGTLVWGVGGHTRLQNQILGLNLNQDSPKFDWWQQPKWKTSSVGGAELYHNPAEAAALVAGPRGSAARIMTDNTETASAAAWDRQFPVCTNTGWVWPAKMTTGQLGDNAPHGFRYHGTSYIPASVTGSDGMYLAILGPQGPFAQSYKPEGTLDSEWFVPEALISVNRRKWPYYLRNARTGAWSEHKWQPDEISIGGFGGPKIGVFSDIKRAYVVGNGFVGGSLRPGWYFLDFSAGNGEHTRSQWLNTNSPIELSRYSNGAWSQGDRLGRHFAIFNVAAAGGQIAVYDFDAGSVAILNLSAQGYTYDANDSFTALAYDSAQSRVIVTMQHYATKAISYFSIAVPDDLGNVSGYVVSGKRNVVADGSSAMSWSLATTAFFYGQTAMIHPTLGCVIIPSSRGRSLAFVPY